MGHVLIIIIIYLIIGETMAATFQKRHEYAFDIELLLIGILWPIVILLSIVGLIMNIGYWITNKIIK